ncbi:MAG: AzlD domain-containing protein [Erysipelotrichaceae bacterium]|nr:AzlD domain-containing protein [Erysipelotrichaceae bacterium]
MNNALVLILVSAAVTIAIRFAPFVIFNKKTPKIISDLSELLPSAIMGMLVVYCLKDISFVSLSGFMPMIIGVVSVIIIQKLRHNILLSIALGTVLYMFLVQVIF